MPNSSFAGEENPSKNDFKLPETFLIGVGASKEQLFPIIDFLSQIFEEVPQSAFVLNLYDTEERINDDIIRIINKSTFLKIAYPEGKFIPQPQYIYCIPSNFCCTLHGEFAEAHFRKPGIELDPVEVFFKSYVKEVKISAINLLFSGLSASRTSRLKLVLGKQSFSAFEVPVSQKGGADRTWFDVRSRMKVGFEGYESMKTHLIHVIKNNEPVFYQTRYSVEKETVRKTGYHAKNNDLQKEFDQLRAEHEKLKRAHKKLQDKEEKEHRQLETLSLEQSKIAALLANSQEGMLIFDHDGEILTFNKMADSILNSLTGKHLAMGTSVFDLVNPKSPNSGNNLKKALAGERIVGETEELLPTGISRWYRYQYYPLKTDNQLSLIALSIQDITDLKKAKSSFTQKTEEWFKAVLDASRDGLVAELDEKIFHCNTSLLRQFGYHSEKELLGQPVNMLLSEESQKKVATFSQKRIKGEKVPETYEVVGVKADGSFFDMELSATAAPIGGRHFIITSFRDITQRKRAEKKLRNKNIELSKMNSELDRFVYSASHDLRAPLNSILGILQIARLEKSKEVPDQYLGMIETNIGRLKEFLNDITNYSRNSRLKVKLEKVNLRELVTDIYEGLKYSQSGDQAITFELTFENSLQVALSDRSRLSMVFNNLLSNAIRYADTKKEKPFVKVHVSITEDTLWFTVSDNGEGIPTEHQEKIFDMFYRATESKKGSGLGLYIVKEAVEKLNGRILLASTQNVGSSFRVTLPISPEDSTLE